MTKVKLKDATKELATGAGAVLSDATRVRKSADALMQSLRKLEVKFTRDCLLYTSLPPSTVTDTSIFPIMPLPLPV